MYVAAVLTPESIAAINGYAGYLLECLGFGFKTPTNGDLPHHMTINLGELDTLLNRPDIVGKTVEMRSSFLTIDPDRGAAALQVAQCGYWLDPDAEWVDVCSANAQPHITVALKPGVKPKISNEIFEKSRINLQCDLCLEAVIRLCD